jgi:hypothetical protein
MARPPIGVPPGVPQPPTSVEPGSSPSSRVPPNNGARASRGSRPSAPAATMAHAVPPMPEAPGRAATEQDTRLEQALRTTDHSVPVLDPLGKTDELASQLGDATDASLPAQVPISTAPSSLSPPQATEAMASGPTPACPQCDSPMAWVDLHLRFYCRQCRMYF